MSRIQGQNSIPANGSKLVRGFNEAQKANGRSVMSGVEAFARQYKLGQSFNPNKPDLPNLNVSTRDGNKYNVNESGKLDKASYAKLEAHVRKKTSGQKPLIATNEKGDMSVDFSPKLAIANPNNAKPSQAEAGAFAMPGQAGGVSNDSVASSNDSSPKAESGSKNA